MTAERNGNTQNGHRRARRSSSTSPPRRHDGQQQRRAASVWLHAPGEGRGPSGDPARGWLRDTLARTVTTYGRRDDRILIVNTVPAPPELDRLHAEAESVPGLSNAVRTWLFVPQDLAPGPASGSVQAGSGPPTAGLPRAPGPGPDPWYTARTASAQDGPDRFGLILVGLGARNAAVVGCFPWATVLASGGLLAVITPCRGQGEGDPLGSLTASLRATGLAYHDRITVIGPRPGAALVAPFLALAEIALFMSPTLSQSANAGEAGDA